MILAVGGRGLETRLVGLGIRRNGFDGEMWLGLGSAHGRVAPHWPGSVPAAKAACQGTLGLNEAAKRSRG